MAAIFRHPASDYTQSNEGACPSTFLAGPFYLAARRAWGAAFGMTATLLLWAALSYFVLDTHTGLAVAGWLLALHQWCWGMAANEMVSRAYLRRGWTLEESTPSPVVWEMVTPGVCLFLGLFFAVASV